MANLNQEAIQGFNQTNPEAVKHFDNPQHFNPKYKYAFISYLEESYSCEIEDSFDQWLEISFADGSSILMNQMNDKLEVKTS